MKLIIIMENEGDKIRTTADRILEVIKNSPASAEMIAEYLGEDIEYVEKILNIFEKKGIVKVDFVGIQQKKHYNKEIDYLTELKEMIKGD